MTGVYTDNQPDFTWLKPHEEKTFVQYFMPYKQVGRVGNATKDAMLSITKDNQNKFTLKVYATGTYTDTDIQVIAKDTTIYKTTADLSPKHVLWLSLQHKTI